MDYITGKGIKAALRSPNASGLTLTNGRLYYELRTRFGPGVDTILESLSCSPGGSTGGGTAPVAPVPGLTAPTAPGTSAPGTTAEQESTAHRILCNASLRNGLAGLVATVPDATVRSRVQGAIAALELYCSGGNIDRRTALAAVCALTSLPGVRTRLATMGAVGIVAAGVLTAACALGPNFLPTGGSSPPLGLPAPLSARYDMSMRAAGARRRSALSQTEMERVHSAVAALDPREALMRSLAYVSTSELAEVLAHISTTGGMVHTADVFVTSIMATAMRNAETEADAAYILGGEGGDDERVLDAGARESMAAVIATAVVEG